MRRFNIHPSIYCTCNNAMTSCAQYVRRAPLQLTWFIKRFHFSPFVTLCSLLSLTNAPGALNVNFLFSLYGMSYRNVIHIRTRARCYLNDFALRVPCTECPVGQKPTQTLNSTPNACSEYGIKNVSHGAFCVKCECLEAKEIYACVKSHFVFIGSAYPFLFV